MSNVLQTWWWCQRSRTHSMTWAPALFRKSMSNTVSRGFQRTSGSASRLMFRVGGARSARHGTTSTCTSPSSSSAHWTIIPRMTSAAWTDERLLRSEDKPKSQGDFRSGTFTIKAGSRSLPNRLFSESPSGDIFISVATRTFILLLVVFKLCLLSREGRAQTCLFYGELKVCCRWLWILCQKTCLIIK